MPVCVKNFIHIGTFNSYSNPKKLILESEVAHSCPTFCDPMDCSLPGSSVHGILQAGILEWVARLSSRASA